MEEKSQIHDIPINQIKVSLFNVRTTDVGVGIDELAESIKEYGLLQPVVMSGKYGTPPYELIVGQRRLLAYIKLGKEKIPAVFYDEGDELKLKMLSLSENMQRVELNYADKAEAITTVYVALGRNAQKTGKKLSLSVPTILDYVKIEEQATDKAKEYLKDKKINKTDMKRIINAAQGVPETIDNLLVELPKLTKYEKDRAVSYGKKKKAPAEKIIEEAKKPKFEKTVILNLDEETNGALLNAEKKLSMDREQIASLALGEWLKDNGFLKRS